MPQKYSRTHETSTQSGRKQLTAERRHRRLKILRASALLLMAAALLLPLMHARTATAEDKTNLQALMQRRRVRTGAARPASPRPAKAQALAATDGCATPFTEAASSPFIVGDGPTSIAVADFNKDGKPDMASANSFSDDVSILLGNGAGSFSKAASSPITVGVGPVSVAAGDFNNDGNPDLAVVNVVDGNVTILLGNGLGGFTEPAGSPVDVGEAPLSVVVTDFNNDGKQDLATANFDDGDVTILLGDGSGGFAAATGSPVTVGTDPSAVAVADFNKDGKPDLATANNGSDDVTILLGDGSGGFTATGVSPTVGNSPASIAAGDFNNDAKPDLAVGNDNSGDVTILLGDGLGGFTEPAGSPIFTGFGTSASVVDFNNDGKQDLAAASLAFNDVTILVGDGAGGFTESAGSPVAGHEGPFMVAVGDFNNDGRQDLATPNADCTDVTLLLNTCDAATCSNAKFVKAPGVLPTGGVSLGMDVGDFNGDGKLDLTTANISSGNVTIMLGNGAGAFTNATGSPIPVGDSPAMVVVGDFNGDGKQDVAAGSAGSNNVTILLGDGTGGFTKASGSPIPLPGRLPVRGAVGDFNRDGKQDLVTADATANGVTILLGDGTGGFSQAPGSPIATGNNARVPAVGDFNRDGKQDVAVVNYGSSNVTILLGDGTGGFSQAAGSPVAAGNHSEWVAIGDFNRDGKQDLAVANVDSRNVTILLGNGTGGFSQAAGSPFLVGHGPNSLVVGDFNNDGKDDVATANRGDDNVTILLGNGTGGFSQPFGPLNTGSSPNPIVIGDFNNDGKQDLVTSDNFSNGSVFLNGCVANADLSITMTDIPDPVLAGEKLTYHIVVTNNLSTPAPDVFVTDRLAPSTTLVSAQASQGGVLSFNNGVLTMLLHDIPGNGAATVDIVVQTTEPTVATNTAVVKSTATDPTPDGNVDSETTKVIGLQSLSFSPALLTGGCWNSRYNGTVTLTAPAPPGGVLVKLSDDAAEVSSPVSVRVEKGQTTATFTGGAGMVTSVREVMFTATAGATTVKKKLTVQPVRITSLSLAPNPVRGGTPVTGSFSLTCAPTSDVTVTLTSGRWAAWLPARQITVPAGHATGKFTVNTLAVGSPIDALITATANGAAKSATLHIVP